MSELTAPSAWAGAVHHEAVMGTVVTFDVRTPAAAEGKPPAAEGVAAAVEAAVGWLHWVDTTFSTYQHGSEVNRFDRGELAAADCCAELRHILALCHELNRATGGFFDAWATPRFDPSGVVKGWSIEQASSILVAAGFPDHAIDGGGDIRLRGTPGPGTAWEVGVRHPRRREAYSAALSLGEAAVATSGTYERGAHVINPFTGRPATELASVTVVGPELTTADGYATAALAMGADAPGWLADLDGYETQVVSEQGRGWSTPGFKRLERQLLGSN
jgi:thiamine biosynthesis lipoprotein